MRSLVLFVICAGTSACVATGVPDPAHHPVALAAPYSELPPAPPGIAIERGTRVVLDARQQEAVVAGVIRWMKVPASTQFGIMNGSRNSRGLVTVCGDVRGRNGAGTYAGMAPYIGVLIGTNTAPEFVVVGIAGSERERAEVASLCRETGAALPG